MSKTMYDHEAIFEFIGHVKVHVRSKDKDINYDDFWNEFENLDASELIEGIDFDTARIESAYWDIYCPDEDDVV